MFANRNINFTSWVGYGGNLVEFQKSAANAGHFNPFTDQDGIVRRVPMIAELDGAYYEALSLAVVRTLLGFPKLEPGFTETGMMQGGYSGLEWLRTGPLTIPVDDSVSALVPFRGDRYSFPYISISDILADRVQPAQLKGRIALVGATASGLFDLRATPVNSVYAGVEVHANMIAGILDYVFDDPILPLPIKAVFRRLQVPLLKAALLDHGVLSESRHPVRRFFEVQHVERTRRVVDDVRSLRRRSREAHESTYSPGGCHVRTRSQEFEKFATR